MYFFKWFFVFFVVEFSVDVITINPLLTYTMRFQRIAFQPNVSGNCTIHKVREKEFINGNISIDSEHSVDKVIVVFNRCNPEGINCEYFQAWTLTDVCSLLRDKKQVWSSWYGSFHPPIAEDCPLPKYPKYEVMNGSIDIGPVVRWYPDAVNYYWKVTQKLYAGDLFIGSYSFDLSIFGYRKRKPKY